MYQIVNVGKFYSESINNGRPVLRIYHSQAVYFVLWSYKRCIDLLIGRLNESLEHIKAEKLIDRLDEFLGRPKFDPHGDPIPDADGNFTFRKQILLTDLAENQTAVVVGVLDDSPSFLQYLDKLNLVLGAKVKILERIEYDGSNRILLNDQQEQILTNKVCQNLYVKTL